MPVDDLLPSYSFSASTRSPSPPYSFCTPAMLYCAPRALLRVTLRSPRPPTLPLSPPHLTRLARPFHASPPSRAAPALSANLDHYSILGLHKNATRKEIKERFYDVSFFPSTPLPLPLSPSRDRRLRRTVSGRREDLSKPPKWSYSEV